MRAEMRDKWVGGYDKGNKNGNVVTDLIRSLLRWKEYIKERKEDLGITRGRTKRRDERQEDKGNKAGNVVTDLLRSLLR